MLVLYLLMMMIVMSYPCLMSTDWSTGLRRVGRAGPTPAEEQLHILRNLDKEVVEESRRMEVGEAKGA